MFPSDWILCQFDIDRSSEFTGDDVDQYSDLVDLGHPYEFITVIFPTIDSATITPYVQKDGNIATVPIPMHFWHDNNADTNIAQATVAGTGGLALTFNIGGFQHLRLKASANQTADRDFYIRGFNR